MRVSSTAAVVVFLSLLTLASPTLCLAGGPYGVTDITVLNGKPHPDVPYMKHWFLPGENVQVKTTVRNNGSAPGGRETIRLRPQLEFVPGPGQAESINLVGVSDQLAPPGSNSTVMHAMHFTAPAKEGFYRVRMNVQPGPAKGYDLGTSLILVRSDRPVLFVRRARVLKYAFLKCKADDGGLYFFVPTPLVPIYPHVGLGVGGSNCTPADFARVQVENLGSQPSSAFKVILTDTTGCNPALTFDMPAIAAKKSAWVPQPARFNKTPGAGCNGPYTAAIAPPPNEGGSVGASEIVFSQVNIYQMKGIADVTTVTNFLKN